MLIKQMSDPRTTDQSVSGCLKHQWHEVGYLTFQRSRQNQSQLAVWDQILKPKSNLPATFGFKIPFQGVYFNCSGQCWLSCIYPCGDCTPPLGEFSPWTRRLPVAEFHSPEQVCVCLYSLESQCICCFRFVPFFSFHVPLIRSLGFLSFSFFLFFFCNYTTMWTSFVCISENVLIMLLRASQLQAIEAQLKLAWGKNGMYLLP